MALTMSDVRGAHRGVYDAVVAVALTSLLTPLHVSSAERAVTADCGKPWSHKKGPR